jgi:hypothetical protein
MPGLILLRGSGQYRMVQFMFDFFSHQAKSELSIAALPARGESRTTGLHKQSASDKLQKLTGALLQRQQPQVLP